MPAVFPISSQLLILELSKKMYGFPLACAVSSFLRAVPPSSCALSYWMQQDLDVGAPPGLGFPPAWFPEAAVQDRKAQGRSEGAAANVPLTCLDEAQGLVRADRGGGVGSGEAGKPEVLPH